MKTQIGVLGAGSWGTALAIRLARNGHTVTLWGRSADKVAECHKAGCNPKYLPGTPFPPGLHITADLKQALTGKQALLLAIPSKAFRATVTAIHQSGIPAVPLVMTTKGLDATTGDFLTLFVQQVLPDFPLGVLAGPSFAQEVARDLPTAVTIASQSENYLETIIPLFLSKNFRVYGHSDVLGVQYGGVMKNILATAAGISDGLGYGTNTRAAVISRGFAESVRLAESLHIDIKTLTGLSGLGDLLLTCSDNQSRNRRFGIALGQGSTVVQAQQTIGQVVEAVDNVAIFSRLAEQHQIKMPITEALYAVLQGQKSPSQAADDLLARHWCAEFDIV